MKKLFMTLLLLPLVGAVIAQDSDRPVVEDYESLRYTVFFEGANINTRGFERERLDKVGKWLNENKDIEVILTGWAEPTKSEANDIAVAEKRAKAVKSYLMRNYKVAEDRITVKEGGVDSDNVKSGISRRVDFWVIAQRDAYIPPVFNTLAPLMSSNEATTGPSQKSTSTTSTSNAVDTSSTAQSVKATKSKKAKSKSCNGSFYLGAGAGTAFGISTFSTATQDGTTPSIAAQIFAGYKFAPVVSVELAFGYTKLEMQSPDLYDDVYYANGQRILTLPEAYSYPLAAYSDLTSYSTLYSVTAKVNIDITAINNKADFKKWAFLTSPKIGFIYSDATVDDIAGVTYIEETANHISMGLDLSAVYSFNERYGLRLTTGADYVTGDGIDAMPQADVNSNFIWATNLNFIVSF